MLVHNFDARGQERSSVSANKFSVLRHKIKNLFCKMPGVNKNMLIF
jgi:hypothetical protein